MTPAFKRWLRGLDADYRRKRGEYARADMQEFVVPDDRPTFDRFDVEQLIASTERMKP